MIGWMRSNVFDVGGSNIGTKGIGKHLKRQKGEGIETEKICDKNAMSKSCSDSKAEETSKKYRNVQVNMST